MKLKANWKMNQKRKLIFLIFAVQLDTINPHSKLCLPSVCLYVSLNDRLIGMIHMLLDPYGRKLISVQMDRMGSEFMEISVGWRKMKNTIDVLLLKLKNISRTTR
ncbi:hypothetical protein Dsin_013134 [Dipteronia sinensis]|uniref:Uncharacterized protein n=1 Tax=Dipteronia sinensis TaxID=43782 RepID=A0AAE0AKM8_9ROSI|nr:hypothetical protein Dsin_013134 [Dipteronia sinensis]